MNDLISIHDLTASEISDILALASDLKQKQKNKEKHEYLWAKSLAMIFEKPSTRTRVSFEIGMWQLGGLAINLDQGGIGLGVRESIHDVAKTLSRYADGILIRTFEHEKVVKLAEASEVPIINGLSDLAHPCQALTDIFTVLEKKAQEGPLRRRGLKMAYVGDGNNVCNSLMVAAAKVGVNMIIATPVGFEPNEIMVKHTFESAKQSGVEIDIVNDPVIAVKGADVIYTDVWASMGQEKQADIKNKKFKGFQVNRQLVQYAKPDYIFMHCLPAHRGLEVTDEVIDSKNSVVFDQAENRLHVQKAILVKLLGNG